MLWKLYCVTQDDQNNDDDGDDDYDYDDDDDDDDDYADLSSCICHPFLATNSIPTPNFLMWMMIIMSGILEIMNLLSCDNDHEENT